MCQCKEGDFFNQSRERTDMAVSLSRAYYPTMGSQYFLKKHLNSFIVINYWDIFSKLLTKAISINQSISQFILEIKF